MSVTMDRRLAYNATYLRYEWEGRPVPDRLIDEAMRRGERDGIRMIEAEMQRSYARDYYRFDMPRPRDFRAEPMKAGEPKPETELAEWEKELLAAAEAAGVRAEAEAKPAEKRKNSQQVEAVSMLHEAALALRLMAEQSNTDKPWWHADDLSEMLEARQWGDEVPENDGLLMSVMGPTAAVVMADALDSKAEEVAGLGEWREETACGIKDCPEPECAATAKQYQSILTFASSVCRAVCK